MDFKSLQTYLSHDGPPAEVGLALQVLWHEAKGNWDQAGTRRQSDKSVSGTWVHADLHRKEGDT